MTKKDSSKAPQAKKFIRAARELGADQSEEAFNEALRKIARASAQPKKPKARKPKESSSEG